MIIEERSLGKVSLGTKSWNTQFYLHKSSVPSRATTCSVYKLHYAHIIFNLCIIHIYTN